MRRRLMTEFILLLISVNVKSIIFENIAVDFIPKYEDGGFISYDKLGKRKDISLEEVSRKYLK
jgi:hypothetical protein